MILINLLPHREARRAQRKRTFFAGLALSALAGALVVGIWLTAVQQAAAAQEARNGLLAAEIKRLEAQIKDIASLRAEIESLKARQAAVEDSRLIRMDPVEELGEGFGE